MDWIETKNVKLGYQLAIADVVPISSDKVLQHARLLGLLVGDGYYADTPVLSNNDPDIWKFIFKNYRTSTKVERVCKDGLIYKECSILGVRKYLKEVGMLGQSKERKTFPTDIHSYDKSSISDFIGGLFDTDGCVLKDRLSFATAYYSLADELRFLLHRFGIHCTIHKKRNKPNKLVQTPSAHYELQVRDRRSILRFFRNITFISSTKQRKLLTLYVNTKKVEKHFSKELIGLRFETVTGVESIGVQPVYNLTADVTHTYIGNGIVTHNTQDAYEIFYHPEKYDCLPFDDIWEHKGSIGYFVPAYLGLNQYKDSTGVTNVDAALKFLKEQRAKLSKGSDSGVALEAEIINRPIAPSEIFLVKTGNIFPVIELSNRLHEIERENITSKSQKVIDLFFDPKSPTQVSYKLLPEPVNRPINQFPYNGNNREGAIVVYEFPAIDPATGQPPRGLYIIGHDPYASDNPEGDSLAAIYVLKTKAHMGKYGHDEIVASYVGRPFQGRRVVNEILHKMSLFYGDAKIYFENAVGNTKEYFEKVKRLDLLARRPTTVLSARASYDMSPRSAMEYGYPMSNKTLKVEAINYVRDWLLEVHHTSNDREIRNLDIIQDEGLIRECISFNFDMNADRVMAFAGCIVGLEETFNQYRTQLDATVKQVSLDFLSHNPHIFKTYKHGDFPSLIPEAKTLF